MSRENIENEDTSAYLQMAYLNTPLDSITDRAALYLHVSTRRVGSADFDAQRQMAKRAGATIVEVKGSHSIYVSRPQAVATLIEKAAKGALPVAAH